MHRRLPACRCGKSLSGGFPCGGSAAAPQGSRTGIFTPGNSPACSAASARHATNASEEDGTEAAASLRYEAVRFTPGPTRVGALRSALLSPPLHYAAASLRVSSSTSTLPYSTAVHASLLPCPSTLRCSLVRPRFVTPCPSTLRYSLVRPRSAAPLPVHASLLLCRPRFVAPLTSTLRCSSAVHASLRRLVHHLVHRLVHHPSTA